MNKPLKRILSGRKNAPWKLSFKNEKEMPPHRLPFVGYRPGGKELSFWAVPRSGGYGGGCDTGRALALIYLKHLRENGICFSGGTLQSMVLDLFDCQQDSAPEISAIRGQAVGFFSEIERWLEHAARSAGANLDGMQNEDLLKQANAGLEFDEQAYIARFSTRKRKAA